MKKKPIENYVIFTDKNGELVIDAKGIRPFVICSYGRDDDDVPYIRNEKKDIILLGKPADPESWVKPIVRSNLVLVSLHSQGLIPKEIKDKYMTKPVLVKT